MIYDRMDDCFASMEDKIAAALKESDLVEIFEKLDRIEGATLVCGVGGSAVVARFLAKVLREKRHILCTFCSPRDLVYMDLSAYDNVIAVSYSGRNIGVDVIFETKLKKYLFTGHPREDVENIVYHMPEETSYVSINATVIPLSILLLYYCEDHRFPEGIRDETISIDDSSDLYEVMSGYETLTAASLLESCFTESGMAACVIHDKYDFCHGRINLSRMDRSHLIFFRSKNELDDLLYRQLHGHYERIITIDRRYEDDVIEDYRSCILSLKLIHEIALRKGAEISDMNELEDNDVFYRYAGKMK